MSVSALAQNPPAKVTTHRNDNARTGLNPNEYILKPPPLGMLPPPTGTAVTAATFGCVTPSTFGKLYTRSVDGSVYAQPLYVPYVDMPTKPHYMVDPRNPKKRTLTTLHNLLIVATAHNSVYCFDADSNQLTDAAPLWYVTYNYPQAGVTPVSSLEVGSDDISPEVGITGTPVIDCQPQGLINKGTLYFVVKSKEGRFIYQRLHALDLTTGQEKFGRGTLINAAVPGIGDDTDGDPTNPQIHFNSTTANQQAALALSKGIVYLTFGSHGDQTPFHGWVLAYKPDAVNNTLALCGAFNTSPNGVTDPANGFPEGAGITMGGSGPAIDSAGNLFFTTGVGSFNADSGGTEYGNSVVKMNFFPAAPKPPTFPPAPVAPVCDYFTPFDWFNLSTSFTDLGTGGVTLADGVGPGGSDVLVTAGQEGTIYLVDRNNMGFFHAGDDSNILQFLFRAVGPMYGSPAYNAAAQQLYFQGSGDILKMFAFNSGFLSSTPDAQVPDNDVVAAPISVFGYTSQFGFPGASPVISGDGTTTPGTMTNGIVWTLEKLSPPPNVQDPGIAPPVAPVVPALTPIAVLHAYKVYDPANDFGTIQELYTGLAVGTRDSAGESVNYTPPTVAGGHVFVAAKGQVTVFGPLPIGTVAGPVQADHFIVTGPVNSGATSFIFGGSIFPLTTVNIGLNQKVGYNFGVTAIGSDGNPMKLNGRVHLSYRNLDNDSLHYIGEVTFANDANAYFTYAFRDLNNNGYEFWLTDDYGHTSLQPNFDHPIFSQYDTPGIGAPILIVGTATAGFDHLLVSGPTNVRSGQTITLAVKIVSATNTPVPVRGNLAVYDTLPNSTQTVDNTPGVPGFAYENVSLDPLKQLVAKFTGTASTTVKVPIKGIGKHIIVITGGGITASILVNATP